MKKLMCLLIVIGISGFVFSSDAADKNTIVLKVVGDTVNVREGTGKKSKVVSTVKYGTMVGYMENSGVVESINDATAPWIKIQTPDGKAGYIFGSMLTFVSSPDGLAPYIEYMARPKIFKKKDELLKTPADRRYIFTRHWFSKKELSLLSQKGFSVEKMDASGYINVDDMIDNYLPYADIRKTEEYIKTYDTDVSEYKQLPVYITSDYMLHCFHLIFDRMLENIESAKLYSSLRKLSKMEYDLLYSSYTGEKDPQLKKVRFNAVCFAAVPYAILSIPEDARDGDYTSGLTVIRDKQIQKIVLSELKYIFSMQGPEINAITNGKTDYTQFTVRGHYTHSSVLGNYFRAMIWYGSVNFPLKTNPLEGAVIADTFRNKAVMQTWISINNVIEKLVGRSDDLGPREYLDAAEKAFGTNSSLPKYPDNAAIAKYTDEVGKLDKSKIVSSPLRNAAGSFDSVKSLSGFRFMGQRFILDSRIFTLLTSPRVGDDAHPRNIPKGLDLFAVYGSPTAESLIIPDIKSIPNFKDNYNKAKEELRSRDLKNPTVYEMWIDLLGYHAGAKDKVKQRFTNTPEWSLRKLLAVHGSWAELRHDTILYSKPSAAECGGGEGEEVWVAGAPYIPRGYVEPDYEFFAKLSALASLLRDACAKEGLLSDAYKLRTEKFLSISSRLTDVAKKEIDGKAFTDEDAIYLGALNKTLAAIVLPPDRYADSMTSQEKQMALIADVHTDFMSGAILHVGTGSPQRIRIFVKDASGTRVCEGFIFSYYEFTFNTRMTDEKWKEKVYDNKSKDWMKAKEPAWLNGLPYTE